MKEVLKQLREELAAFQECAERHEKEKNDSVIGYKEWSRHYEFALGYCFAMMGVERAIEIVKSAGEAE